MITLLAACSSNGVIGRNGQLPWKRPEDLRYFREQTIGKTVVMGRKTFDSLGRRPLQGRHNIIVTRSTPIAVPTEKWTTKSFPTVEEALAFSKDVIVIGGGELYRQCLPLAHCINLTKFDFEAEGDVFFPEFDYKPWTILGERVPKGTRWIFKR